MTKLLGSAPIVPLSAARSGLHAPSDMAAFARMFENADVLGEQLIQTILDPKSLIARINEQVALEDTKYSFTVSRELIARTSDATTLLVPILTPRRGVLIAGLEVTSSEGHAWVLPHHQTVGALLGGIRSLITLAKLDEAERTEVMRTFEFVLGDRSPSDQEDDETRFASVTEILSADPGDQRRHALGSLLRALQQYYFLVAVVHRTDIPALTLTTKFIVGARTHTDALDNVLRVSLGLGVRRHQFRLAHAYLGTSYHWNAVVPEGLYVFDVSVERVSAVDGRGSGADMGAAQSGRNHSTTDPAIRLNRSHGLDFVHVYARDLVDQGDPSHKRRWQYLLKLDLRERPPGLLGVVVILNVYLTALIWGVGHYHNLVFPVPGPDSIPSNWPTVLFGIPALISGWLISRFTPAGIRWVSLTTLFLTSWTIINAFAAVTVAALKLSVGPLPEVDVFGVTVVQPTWTVVMASSAMALTLSLVVLSTRSLRFLVRVV